MRDSLYGGGLRAIGAPHYLLFGLAVVATALSVLLIRQGHELALINSESGQFDGAREFLEKKFADGDRSPATVGALARIHAKRGDLDSAIDLVQMLVREKPNDIRTLETLAGYYRDGKRTSDYVKTLERLQQQAAEPERQREIARVYGDLGMPLQQRMALQELVGRFGIGEVGDLLTLAQLQTAAGESARALATLDRMSSSYPQAIDASVVAAQMRALLAIGDPNRALGRGSAWLRSHPASPPKTALMLAGALSDGGRSDLAVTLLDPYVGAGADSQVITVITGLHLRLGEHGKALQLLNRVLSESSIEPGLLAETARLYIRLGRAQEGRTALERVRRERPSPQADEAWALVATASRQNADVEKWLVSGGSRNLPATFYQDLVHLANDAGAHALAAVAAERLNAIRGSESDRLLLANALLASGRPREALPLLRALSRKGGIDEDRYAAALLAAWRKGEPAAEELRGIWRKRLADAKKPAERDLAVANLVELGAHAELLPTFAALTVRDPERWLGAFTEAATKAGRREELVALWTILGERAETPVKLRRQVAFRLLETGEKKAAERIFRSLATSATRDDPAARQLLFLWGPRPAPEQLDWLEARARQANGDEKAKWMRDLTERGGATRTIAVYRTTGGEAAGYPVLDAYLQALVAGADKATLATALQRNLVRARSLPEVRRLMEFASQVGDPTLERQLLERAVAAGGGDDKIQRALGMLAYRTQDFVAAERSLAAIDARTGGDYEIQMVLGEIRLKQRDATGARRRFEGALSLLDATGDASPRARTVRASLLHRLGRVREAETLYQALLSERPNDTHLRADYVSLLLESGNLRQAQAALAHR
jgi:tetratricopeptide (TPR) repeat protein